MRLIVVVVVESRMCWSIRFVSLSRSECVRRICLRVWNLELGPLAFGGTRPAASHQLACRFPAHPLLFFMARAAEQHAYLSSSVASTPLKTACTHSQPNPASRTPQSNERTNESVSLVGLGETTCRPARRGLDASSSSSPDVRAPALYYCRAGGSVMAYRFAATSYVVVSLPRRSLHDMAHAY